MSANAEGNRVLTQMSMLDAGIAPVCPRASSNVMFFPLSSSSPSFLENPIDEVRKFLASLSPEEQKKAKRKFRKLWRRAMSETLRDMKCNATTRAWKVMNDRMMGMITDMQGKTRPSSRTMHYRIHAVYRMFFDEVVRTYK